MKKNGQFIIKKSVQKYKNPWIEVTEDQVIRPNGKAGIFGTVRVLDGSAVLPLDEDGYVYLTKEFKYAIGKIDIETMSGGLDGGERYLTSAKRELKEELGITAKKWVDLGLINPFTSVVKGSQKMFLARKLTFGKDDQEGTENISLVKVKLEEAVKMVMDSVITHGASCVLILKAARYLKK
ncbi:MAG TPA: NUDIX hydrolase [Candidatus Moranbacteria bacterium]|nr:NUDIX hydrolase [Candidatus Moranbacteria bacterium]